jgi:hypothetical protein
VKPPLWAHFLHFGIVASSVLAVVGGFVPGPVGILVAASAGPVKNYLSGIASRNNE